MALIIRLRQQGRTNRQSYRLVVADKRSPRDGKYLEKLGWYDPFAKEEKSLFVEENKIFYWLDKGAMISEKAKALVMKVCGEKFQKFEQDKREKKIKKKKEKKAKTTKVEPTKKATKKAKKETKKAETTTNE